MGAGRIRFNRGPSLMKHFSTNRLSTSTFSSFCVAFATADLTTFSISRVDFGLFVNFNVISASFTSLPRIKSTASRALCGDMRINLPVALLIMSTRFRRGRGSSPAGTSTCAPSAACWRCTCRSDSFILGTRRTVTFENTGWCKLTQLMPDHVFRDIHRNELLTVMHRDRVTDHLRCDG